MSEALKAGPEPSAKRTYNQLDRDVAKKVLGWPVLWDGWWSDGEDDYRILDRDWKPSENIAQAWQVVDALLERKIWLQLHHDDLAWWANFYWDSKDGSGEYDSTDPVYAQTAPEAICMAALRAVSP